MSDITIGVDLGGTRIKAVAINECGNILYQKFLDTNDGDDMIWKQAVSSVVLEIKDKIENAGSVIGISAPGLPNDSNSAIAYMPGRMKGLENFIWTDFLEAKTFVLNDAIAAMMGEARAGAAKNKKNVVMLTLGTGVGGAILIDGKPYQGAFNKAGHIGHMVVDSDGDIDITGMPGSLEDAIGNCSIAKRTSGKFSSTHQLLEAFRNGDSFAAEVWFTSVKKLAISLASLTNILSPEMIILGGGITEAGNDLFDPLEKYIADYEWRTGGNRVEIVKARYGELSGAVGVACYAKEAGNRSF
ncbi:MAG: sugar kinase [Bacteroidetes bacterium GWF2_42_66]|nr:MAG: sugar kinase [Bacteroidetes bacterium GWA2_42_15]OFX96635.1 MAG: sugar kinase [Bacteroidetes bacterium GWE2_42_39]OFY45358.1 MAG: sugar kinase [Bacteroidetes bacterium GWF2_42_66]HAZ02357.1 ROK family protein [Marinilabiliales bacterium]HBL76427.1 ROK family protein [Prolixibacteraceae bacterium]